MAAPALAAPSRRETHSMTTAPATIWNLARRLIVLEAARDELSASHAGGAGRVCDRLRAPLARLAGVAGFYSLLSRALAKAEVVSLRGSSARWTRAATATSRGTSSRPCSREGSLYDPDVRLASLRKKRDYSRPLSG